MGEVRRGGGFGWVDENGGHGHGATEDVKSPLVAELRAIVAAIRAHKTSRPLHIVCDSRGAIKVVKYAHDPARRKADPDYQWPSIINKRLLGELHAALTGRDVTIAWVRGHLDPEKANGEERRRVVALNNAADRLAVGARRAMQMNLEETVLAETVTSVLADTFPLTARVPVSA